MQRKLAAEFLGTFWLVFCGCGYVLFGPTFADTTISMLGIALTFGLAVLTMAYAVGHISGGHFNPAVSLGMVVAGRMPARDLAGYIITQVVAAVVAGAVLYLVASGKTGFTPGNFASTGYGEWSPGGYSVAAALVAEIVMTAFFIFIILAVTSPNAAPGFAPLAIGLALTVIQLGALPVSGASVNPARSTGTAVFADGGALGQLWLFWVAPIVGAVIGALVWKSVFEKEDRQPMGVVPAE